MLRIDKTHLVLVFIFIFIFIGDCLMTWLCKKQNSISLSTIEAEYIIVGSYCT